MKRSLRVLKRPATLLLLALLAVSVPGAAAASKRSGKVILVVLDQTSLSELKQARLPNIGRLIAQGAIGAMNVRTPAQDSVSAGYVSVGAGGKAVGVPASKPGQEQPEAWEGFGADEMIEGRRASDIYRERTGRTVKAPSVVNLSISQIEGANQEEALGTRPGALGDALHTAGLKTAVLGNSDTRTLFGRSAVDLVMDGRGRVDYGEVGRDTLTSDLSFPTGVRSDPARLLQALRWAYPRADVIAVEWGDTSRVEAERGYMSATVADKAKRRALEGADRFLGSALKVADLRKDTVIIVVPNASGAAVKDESLMTPTVMAGHGATRGILATPTTRQAGVLVDIDIAPTVLRLVGRSVPADMIGRPLTGTAFAGDALDYLVKANDAWVAHAHVDAPVLRVFAVWDIIVIVAFVLLLVGAAYRPWAERLKSLLLTVPAGVLVMILLPVRGWTAPLSHGLGVALLTAATVAAVAVLARRRGGDPGEPLILLGGVTVAVIMLDLLTGGNLAKASLIGPSVIYGARFYGLGNEFSGVLVGSTIIAVAVLLDRIDPVSPRSRRVALALAGLFMLLVAVAIGHPSLGANFGMLLAALAGFGVALIGFVRGRVGWKELTGLAAVSLLIVMGLFLYDTLRAAGAESHVGRLIEAMRAAGLAPLAQVIERKITMNVRLIQFAFWNWVNIASLGVLLLSVYALRDFIKRVSDRYRHYKWALIGGVVGGVASLAFNDSGVVAMAMVFLFLVPSTLYLMAAETEMKPERRG